MIFADPHTTALYCASVVDNHTYCRNQDDIIVVEFDGDEGEVNVTTTTCGDAMFLSLSLMHKGLFPSHLYSLSTVDEFGNIPHRHIPARFVTMMPRESSSYKRKRKSITAVGGEFKRRPSSSSKPVVQRHDTIDQMLLEMYGDSAANALDKMDNDLLGGGFNMTPPLTPGVNEATVKSQTSDNNSHGKTPRSKEKKQKR